MDGPVRIAAPSSTWTLETAYQYATQRAVPPSEPDGEPLYNCPFPPCSKQFSKRFNLKAHLRVHTGDKPFACNFPGCSRRFMWKSSLTSHHTGHNRRNAHIAKRNAAAAAAVLADVAARSAPLTSSISASHPLPPEQRALPAPPFCRAPSPYHPQHAAAAPPAHASSQPLPSYDAASYAQHAAASHAPPLRVHPPLSQPLPSIQAPMGTPMDSKRDPLHPHLAPIAPKHEPQRIFPMAPMAPKVEPQPQLQPPQPQAMHSHASAMHAHAPPALASAAQPVTPTTLTPARELLSRDTFMSKSPPPALLPCASTFMHGSSTLLPSTSTLLPSPSLLPRSPGAFGQHMSFAASPSWGAPLSHGVGRAVSPMTRGAGDVPMAAASSTSGELSPLAVSPGVSSSSTAVNAGRWRRGGAAGGRASKPPLGGPGLTAGANALLPPLAHVAPKNPPTHIDLGGLGDEEHSSSLPALGSPHTELSPLPVASPIFGTSQTPPSPIQQPFSPFSGGPVSSAKSRAPAAWYP